MKLPLKPVELVSRIKKLPRWLWVIAGVAAVALIIWVRAGGGKAAEGATFVARRGPLPITVLEGGSIKAVDSQEIKCEVRVGYQGIKILKIVEEGYEVTDDDIRTNKVLVELDSSDLQKQITQQDIQYETAAASLTDAQQNYEIQLNQNLSDIKAAEQKVRFARMDFDKFLGDQVTQEIVDQLGLEKEMAEEQTDAQAKVAAMGASAPRIGASAPMAAATVGTNAAVTLAPAVAGGKLPAVAIPGDVPIVKMTAATNGAALPALAGSANEAAKPGSKPAAGPAQPAERPGPAADPVKETPKAEPQPETPSIVIDFLKYAHIEALGDGEAKQKLRKFEDDLQVAKKEEGQAKSSLEGTRRLFDKGFVTKNDLEREELTTENNRLKVQTAETARDLFMRYEFQKTAEESLSKYVEAVRELARARKAAVSRLAQAQAKLKSAQGQFNIQSRQRKEFYEQLDKCTITAKRKGLVVYGGGREDMFYYGGEERIREGASVRERQSIITIPDMSKMSVRVKIHESYIKQVKKGQKARITVDAFPDKVLDGEVTQVGVLPDSQNMWMNPDMKVYLTTITINGTQDWLKPGMSAKVEILVNRLDDVIYVPVQAVSAAEGKQVCYVANGGAPERRFVQAGEFNDDFIEIKNGLKVGERVLLRAAETPPPEQTREKEKAEPAGKEKAAPRPVAPPAVSASAAKT